jgi:hypothetical protein
MKKIELPTDKSQIENVDNSKHFDGTPRSRLSSI